MSYPYIERGGHRISLIEPFTIDNKLVTKFTINYDTSWNGEVLYFNVQLNFNECIGFSYRGSLSMLKREWNEHLHNVYESWARHYTNNAVMRECLHMLNRSTDYMAHLFDDVRHQCDNVHHYDIASYKAECRRQGRELNLELFEHVSSNNEYTTSNRTRGYLSFEPTNSRTSTLSWRDYAYYPNTPTTGATLINPDRIVVTTSGTSWNDAIQQQRERYAIDQDVGEQMHTIYQRVYDAYNGWGTQYDTVSVQRSPRVIHSHDYTPEYKKHYLDGEDETTTLLLGAEIEVDNGGKKEEHAKEVLKIMNGEETWENEENIFCVHDGSLNNGFEFPTQPGSLAWHKTLPYKKMFKYLDEHDYKAHDTETCGLHVHINRSFFGEHEAECIGKLMYILEKFNDEFSAIGRRNCRYAKMFGYNGEKCKELYQKGYSIKDKYNAINIMHKDTIELRSFKGTLKYSTYINTLEFVEKLAHFVKSHTEEEIEEMKWLDLYETFSKDLKIYYNERAEIEKQKKKDELKKTGTYGSINIDSVRSVTATDREGNVMAVFNNPQNITLTASEPNNLSSYLPITGTPITGTCVIGGTISGNTIHSIEYPVIEYMDTINSLRHTLRRRPKNNEILYVFIVDEIGCSTGETVEGYHYKESTNEIIVPERYRNKKIVLSYYTIADSETQDIRQITLARDSVPARQMTSVTFETSTYSTESKEDKEKEIKNLKKKLRTERNYLTKIKLQKELTKLQNELKKQNKQDKKQNKTNKVR